MNVTVLGTGTMGAPMARNLAERAFGDVRVWNRSTERAAPLAEAGATVADTIEEAVAGADAVVIMLSDGDAVREVAEQALPAMEDEAILVQMSTIGLDATEAVSMLCAENDVELVDAPVSGTKGPAEKGELVVLASGSDAALDACDAIFDAVGAKTVRLGAAGAGTRMKLVLNAWLVALTETLAETIGLAQSLDLDPQAFLDTIEGGPLDVGYAHVKGGAMIAGDYDDAQFALRLAAKDARLVLDAAKRSELALPVMEATARRMDAAVEAGHGDEDMAAVRRAG